MPLPRKLVFPLLLLLLGRWAISVFLLEAKICCSFVYIFNLCDVESRSGFVRVYLTRWSSWQIFLEERDLISRQHNFSPGCLSLRRFRKCFVNDLSLLKRLFKWRWLWLVLVDFKSWGNLRIEEASNELIDLLLPLLFIVTEETWWKDHFASGYGRNFGTSIWFFAIIRSFWSISIRFQKSLRTLLHHWYSIYDILIEVRIL